MKFLLTFVLTFFSFIKLNAQIFLKNPSISFAKYLGHKKMYSEAVYVLELLQNKDTSIAYADSINYYLGKYNATQFSYNNAHSYFNKVSYNGVFHNQAVLNKNLAFCLTKNYDSANIAIQRFSSIDSGSIYQQFSIASIALLKRDFILYNNMAKNLDNNVAYISKLNFFYEKLTQQKDKSPFLAGTLSALVPGLGKVYAGKKAEALGSFISIASLLVLTNEAYKNDGVKSIPFIGLAGITTIFYLGNIWGSAATVKVKNSQFNNTINNEILINMAVPIQ